MDDTKTKSETGFDFISKPGETEDQYWDRFYREPFGEDENYKKFMMEKARTESKH
jgi:hypothetical protein